MTLRSTVRVEPIGRRLIGRRLIGRRLIGRRRGCAFQIVSCRREAPSHPVARTYSYYCYYCYCYYYYYYHSVGFSVLLGFT